MLRVTGYRAVPGFASASRPGMMNERTILRAISQWTVAVPQLRFCRKPAYARQELGYLRRKFDLMRCMICSEPMLVVAMEPHEAVAGFSYESLQCLACGAAERRLIFGPRASETPHQPDANASPVPLASLCVEPAISVEQQPEICCDPPQSACSSPNPIRAAPAWTRAVEKVRSRQADLHARAEEAKRADGAVQFHRAWDKLAPTPPVPIPPVKPRQERDWSRRAIRAEMRKLSRVTDLRHPPAPAAEPNPQAVERFKQFWEGLVADANMVTAQQEVSVSSVQPPPLPRSLSLVPVEAFDTLERLQAINNTTRVLLLLAGLQRAAA
jgi:hypothetical protein